MAHGEAEEADSAHGAARAEIQMKIFELFVSTKQGGHMDEEGFDACADETLVEMMLPGKC